MTADITADITIAPAAFAECRAVARIHVDAWRAAYAGFVDAGYLAHLSVERRESMWQQAVRTGEPLLLVAKRAGRIVGWIALGPSRDDDSPPARGEIWAVYIDPNTWSGGVGTALVAEALRRLGERGHDSASLWVMCANARAIRFYETAGFTREPASEREFTLGQQPIREVRYVKALRASGTYSP
jgi:ribosomal protein S18 acetylase RimI-like enzyme